MASLAQSALSASEPPVNDYIYRILTERKNIDVLKSWLIGRGIDYTIFQGEGAWHGSPESSIAIELAGVTRLDAEQIALAIKSMNYQEAVLLQEVPARSILL